MPRKSPTLRVITFALIGLILVLGAGTYLYFRYRTLFPENEPTSPGLYRLLAAGGVLLAGLLFLFAAAVHWQIHAIGRKESDDSKTA